MSWIDFTPILLYIGYSIYIGLRSTEKASKNLEEYFLAGRSLSGWKAGISMAATQFSADTPLLVTGLIATAGIFALWQMWIYALAFLLMGFLLSPQWRRANVITDAELTELRYGKKPAAVLRITKAFYFGTVFNCTVLAWVLFASAKIAEPFLQWHLWLPTDLFSTLQSFVQWVGVPVSSLPPGHPEIWAHTTSNFISMLAIVVVTTFYSTTGGLRSVVNTDFVQFGLMMVGTLMFSVIVVSKAGGLDAIHQQIVAIFSKPNPLNITPNQIFSFTPDFAKDASFSVLALFGLQWLIQLNSDGTGYLAQRSMACKSDYDSKLAGVVFAVTQILLRSLLWIPLGLALLVLFPVDGSLTPALQVAAREGTYARAISELLPVGVKGIVITAMLTALASTLDTHLNWGSSYWTNDIYKRFICEGCFKSTPNPRTLVWVARGSNMMILTIALVVMTQLTSIQQAWRISLLLGAGMGPVLLLRWFWWRVNAWSEISAIVVSTAAAPLLLIFVPDSALQLLLMGVLSTAATVGAAYFFGPEDRALLQEFYNRVRPAGFWGPIAGERQKADRMELWKGLSATFITAFSIFCLLVGFGSWMVGSPTPKWMPYPSLWIPGLIVTGLALIPLWIKLGFSERSALPKKRKDSVRKKIERAVVYTDHRLKT